jgi:dipeptidyl aminopeptidase/acylaminoacyl peptidase
MDFSDPASRRPTLVVFDRRARHPRLIILCSLFALLAQSVLSQNPPRLPVEAFATPPHFDDVSISPDGRYIAAKGLLKGKYSLIIYDLENLGQKDPFVLTTDDEEVSWLEWANNDRLLIVIRFTPPRFGTRLLAMNADGSDAESLIKPKTSGRSLATIVAAIQDNVVDLLPDDPEHILLSLNIKDPSRPRIYKVNIYSGRKKMIEKGRKNLVGWLVDQQGRPRIFGLVDDADIQIFHRSPDSGAWNLIREYMASSGAVFSPILFDKDNPNIFYVYSNHAGATTGVYRYDTATNEFIDEIFRHESVDVSGVWMGPKRSDILGVIYYVDTMRTFWLVDTEKNILDAVQKRLGFKAAHVVSKSRNYERVVIFASSPSVPGRYYLYEPAKNDLRYFTYTYPALEKATMSEMTALTYTARDGLEIPAYLSLPPGETNPPQRLLPAVVVPHGGPTARDVARFDPWIQLLTNRGYAVLQMNFRGSAGYGRDFLTSGFKQWGQAMQDDITDGTQWLIEKGIADQERICIFGGSYGGYAALMGAVRESGLYACAVSLNGVSDLSTLIERQRRNPFREVAFAHIGGAWTDRTMLKENSPVNRVDEIKIPVLLVHGTGDWTVDYRQSDAMAKALKKAGASYQYVKIEDADHGLTRGDHRLEFFNVLEKFLATHLD